MTDTKCFSVIAFEKGVCTILDKPDYVFRDYEK